MFGQAIHSVLPRTRVHDFFHAPVRPVQATQTQRAELPSVNRVTPELMQSHSREAVIATAGAAYAAYNAPFIARQELKREDSRRV